MKILQLSKFYPPTHGGLEVVAEFFSRASVALGHDVTVLSVGEESKNYSGRYRERVIQCKTDVTLKSAPFSLRFAREFLRELKETNLLLVHLPNPYTHLLLRIFRKAIREHSIRVIGIYHSDVINQAMLREAYDVHFKSTLDIYDGFVCSSHKLRKSSSILSVLPEEKISVIPFCVDVRSPIRNRTPSGPKRFLSIGRMVPYKGFEFLVNAFRSLPYELTIVGGGPLLSSLKSQAPKNVHFTGEISDEEKDRLFEHHHALIVASINRAEAYGMTIVEAFGHGLPVIASDIDTGVTFLVQNELTGLTFPILSESDLIAQVERCARDTELHTNLSKNCSQFYDSELSYAAFEKNLAKFLAAYGS